MVGKLLIGLIAGVGIAALAYRARSLDLSGAVAAGLLGTIVFGLGGVAWALVLLTFFVTASGLSVVFKGRKSQIADDFAKGSRPGCRAGRGKWWYLGGFGAWIFSPLCGQSSASTPAGALAGFCGQFGSSECRHMGH